MVAADHETQHQPKPKAARRTPPTRFERKATPIQQILRMQAVLENTVIRADTKAADLAGCARAWVDLEKLRMTKAGKPLIISASPLKILPKMRKFAQLRSIDAQIVDVAPEPSQIVPNLSPNSTVDSETPTNAS